MSFEIKVPNDWKKIAENKYEILGISDTEDIKCLGAYVVGGENDGNIISFMNYIDFNVDFLNELDKRLVDINETNALIDGDPSDKDYEDTSLLSNVFHGFTDKYGGNLYININKIPVAEKVYAYTFQIFVEVNNGLVCAQATLRDLDEQNALKSAIEKTYVKDAVKLLFKLKEQ